MGGTILQWTLGFNSYAHQYAHNAGHHDLFDEMYAASDSTTQFLVSCVMANHDIYPTGHADVDAELASRMAH